MKKKAWRCGSIINLSVVKDKQSHTLVIFLLSSVIYCFTGEKCSVNTNSDTYQYLNFNQ